MAKERKFVKLMNFRTSLFFKSTENWSFLIINILMYDLGNYRREDFLPLMKFKQWPMQVKFSPFKPLNTSSYVRF